MQVVPIALANLLPQHNNVQVLKNGQLVPKVDRNFQLETNSGIDEYISPTTETLINNVKSGIVANQRPLSTLKERERKRRDNTYDVVIQNYQTPG